MAFYFREFPVITFDLLKNDTSILIQNPLVRFRIRAIMQKRSKFFYDHTIEDGQSAQTLAFHYYDDPSYDWLIYLANDIVDPQYDWPLTYEQLNSFVRSKYGSIPTAQSTIVSYEQTIQESATLFDGTFVDKRTVTIDANTYGTLAPSFRRALDAYTYEQELNDEKREIRIIVRQYLTSIVADIESALNE
jgi:hypothetical protein